MPTKLFPSSFSGFFRDHSLQTLHAALRQGSMHSVDLVRHAIEAATQNSSLNAFAHFAPQQALRQAETMDEELARGIDRGLFHGIPIAVKDNIMTVDMPTTMGSKCFKDFYPIRDAICVQAIKAVGAIIIGKTTTHEFAYGPTGDCAMQGATHNPWNPAHMPGGSSCGSAVAVASGIVPFAFGSDTGGSVRIPSALTGITGFKPSYGAISCEGVFPLAQTLDHVGLLTKTPLEALAAYQQILSASDLDINDDDLLPKPVRIGWLEPQWFGPQDHTVTDMIRYVLHEQAFGADISNVEEIKDLAQNLWDSFITIQQCEAYAVHAQRLTEQSELYQPEVKDRLVAASQIRGWEYVQAHSHRKKLQSFIQNIFGRYDFFAMPTVTITAPELYQRHITLEQKDVSVRNCLLSLTSIWNLLGFPAVTIPCGFINGLPVGLQLIAPSKSTTRMLRYAQSFLRFE